MANEHYGHPVADNGDLHVIDCTLCGYAHLVPLPTQKQVNAYYEEDQFYTTHGAPDALAKEWREGARGDWNSAYKYQADLICKYGGYGLVDVGCGTGWFMEYYKRVYHVGHVVGIEPSQTALRWSPVPELIHWHGKPECKPLPNDSVRMALVLEHVLNPRATIIDAMTCYMGDGGVFMAVVPNEFNSLQRRVVDAVGSHWYVQKPHINYFSKDSIRRLFESCGLQVVHQSGTFPMEVFYLLGQKYIGDDTVGRKCHARRLVFERRLGRAAWLAYAVLYKHFGWGRETIIVGRRA
jgi:SAM-dependent methyltransferase